MINSSDPIGTDNHFHNIGVSARKQNFEALASQETLDRPHESRLGIRAAGRQHLTA